MKVTVCFGDTKVIVPCGDGDLLVSDLIEKSSTRYKKALGKPPDYWLIVHSLKLVSDGGILDLDDQLKDVVDDREQIVALYEAEDSPPVPHNGGDGTSASSVGTSSPDIFQGREYGSTKEYQSAYQRRQSTGHHEDVVVTKNDLNKAHKGSSLIVRRGSEPSLTKIIPDESSAPPKPRKELFIKSSNAGNKRWSALAGFDETKSPRESEADDERSWDSPPPTSERTGGIGQEESNGQHSHNSSFSTFSRGSSRRSLANNAAMLKWLEAQEKAQEKSETEQGRKEPLGAREDDKDNVTTKSSSPDTTRGELLVISNTSGPLGIHVVPELNDNGVEKGLLIQSVEAGGRIYRDGRIHTADIITEINGTVLDNIDFNKAQEIFRQALSADALRLRILRSPPPLPKQPPPIHRVLSNGHASTIAGDESTTPPDSPTKGPPPPIPARNPGTALSSARFTATNTRKLGKKLTIQLTKGAAGLGFSVTTRDNLAGGHAPIYIKNILPKGAAIEDGRLRSGDRLLEVSGTEVTGKSQTEVVALLRNTKINGVVNLVVSRQVLEDEKEEDDEESPKSEVVLEEAPTPSSKRELRSYDIAMAPAGSAGLGLNVKGKTLNTPDGVRDLGIFVKAIIPEGAAAKDGRLLVNDQLIEVNGDRLEGATNPRAMELLRSAIQKDGDKPGYINILVSRKMINEVRISQSDTSIFSLPEAPPKKPVNAMLAKVQREQSLRNLSYQIANHDSIVNETIDSVFQDTKDKNNVDKKTGGGDDRVRMRSTSTSSSSSRPRPASTLGFLPATAQDEGRMSVSKSSQDLLDGAQSDTDVRSPTEDIDPSDVFRREGFGRQSMSEKRKGHMDPRVSEFYQKIKSGKDGSTQFLSASWDPRKSAFQQVQGTASYKQGLLKRVASAESLLTHSNNRLSLHDLSMLDNQYPPIPPPYQGFPLGGGGWYGYPPPGPPSYGLMSYRSQPCLVHAAAAELKKSNSLESLQRAPQPGDAESEDGHVARGRGINESFRAAVDRSYEGQHVAGAADAMETLEEESESGSIAASRAPSFAASEMEKKNNKKNKKEKTEKEKSDKGLFKGFFKFGKTKKSEDKVSTSSVRSLSSEETTSQRESDRSLERQRDPRDPTLRDPRDPRDNAQRRHDLEEQRFLEQQRMLADKKYQEAARHPEQPPFLRPASPPPPRPPTGNTRADKITQLRMEHQRRHRERDGQYPLDQEEEQIERHLQELEVERKRKAANDAGYYGGYALPPRRRYDDSITYERARPAYAADPDHYSHYQNLKEIQDQIQKHSYYQQQYHSQHSLPPAHHYSTPARDAETERYYPYPHPQGYYPPHYPPYPHHPHYTPVHYQHPQVTKSTSTPQIVVNPPPAHRTYSDYDDGHHGNARQQPGYRDPPYGSLPRRAREMPGAAQV